MKTFTWGFVAGAVVSLGFVLFVLFVYPIVKYWGPCPELTKQESIDFILKDANRPGLFSEGGRVVYDSVELVEESNSGFIVYTKRNGKRVTRHFPMLNCGYLEWSTDQYFKPETSQP